MTTAGDPKKLKNGPCPQCGQPADLDPANTWRPFCSQRCKLLDLGEWFSGRYTLPAEGEASANDADQDDSGRLQ